MCTSFCICPGTPLDDHYLEYQAIPEEDYNAWNRTFLGFDGSINFDLAEGENKPLVWAFDPSTEEENDFADATSANLMECLDSFRDKRPYSIKYDC